MSWATRYKASITNQNQGGGNKKEGLPPSVGTGNLNVWNGMTRAYGTPKDRELQICINQLGSVNPRVYQSRYCGKITSGDGSTEPRDCEPSFEMDINQWEKDTDVITSRYDICFIMDKSGSMGTVVTQPNTTRWVLTKNFVKQFHRQLLLRQTDAPPGQAPTPGVSKLKGSLADAPTSVDPNDGKASSYFDILHRICFISFQTNSEYNISYNTYVSQIYQPNEVYQPNANGEAFPITEGRFAAIIDAIQVAGGTNAHLGLDDAIDMHINQSPYIGPSGDPTDLTTTCGNYMQRDQNPAYAPFVGLPVAPFNGCLPGDIVTSINQLKPSNFIAPPGVTFPNNFDATNSNNIQQNRLPPYPYPDPNGTLTPYNNSGYRNGWRACNTILILLTDGAVNSVPLFNASVAGVDNFETIDFPASRVDPACTLTRIGIGLGLGGSGPQIDNFAWGSVVSANDPFHRSIQNVPLTTTGISDLVNEVLESVTIVNFILTSEEKYIELYLNQNEERICSYSDEQFNDEVIQGENGIVENFNAGDWQLTTLDLTGQDQLTSETLKNLVNANVNFKENIRTLILDGCVGIDNSAIYTQDANGNYIVGPLMEIMDQLELVNLVLSDTGITSTGIDLLVNGFQDINGNAIKGVTESEKLKYLNVDGINLSDAIKLLSIMGGLTNINAGSELECLSMRRCSIGNNMLTAVNNLQDLIQDTSNSKLVHIHLDQNNMDTAAVNTFVTNLNTANVTLISTLKRIFIQFQITPVQGGPLPAPTTATLADWIAIPNQTWNNPLLQLNVNNLVINGQYNQAQINNINTLFTTTINGLDIPIFVVNGFNAPNSYQAWIEIPFGSNNFHVNSTYPYPTPANWIEPGVFNHNNPTPVFGKIIY